MVPLKMGRNRVGKPGFSITMAYCDLSLENVYFILCLFILIIGTEFSCKEKKSDLSLNLPSTPIQIIKDNWGVVTNPVLRIRQTHEITAKPIYTLWKGAVFQVHRRLETKEIIDENENFWYEIKYSGIQGWVFGSYIQIFDSEKKAISVSKELLF